LRADLLVAVRRLVFLDRIQGDCRLLRFPVAVAHVRFWPQISFWQVLLSCHEAIVTNRPLSHKRRRAWQSVTRMSVLVTTSPCPVITQDVSNFVQTAAVNGGTLVLIEPLSQGDRAFIST
jgi:hypothetical protein